jgi:hypothetical protein
MQPWTSWPVERLLYLFLAAAYLLVWIQVTLFHWRGGFRSKFMWGPVLYTPLLIVVALLLGFRRGGLDTAFVALYAIGVLEGMIGVILHARGVASMVGGFNIRNLMAGPPVVLALVYAALSGLGLLVFYWPQIAGIH